MIVYPEFTSLVLLCTSLVLDVGLHMCLTSERSLIFRLGQDKSFWEVVSESESSIKVCQINYLELWLKCSCNWSEGWLFSSWTDIVYSVFCLFVCFFYCCNIDHFAVRNCSRWLNVSLLWLLHSVWKRCQSQKQNDGPCSQNIQVNWKATKVNGVHTYSILW